MTRGLCVAQDEALMTVTTLATLTYHTKGKSVGLSAWKSPGAGTSGDVVAGELTPPQRVGLSVTKGRAVSCPSVRLCVRICPELAPW